MSASRKKVLWVDDEIEFLRSHILFLETRGYTVLPAATGDDAIYLIKENPAGFDIVLLDEQMPGKDGLTTLVEIKKISPDIPVVMVTKSEEEQVMEDAFGAHIDGYLTKPVNPSQILSVCKRLLDSKQILSTQITQRFNRAYSENRTILANPMNAQNWIDYYENMTRWDLELETIDNEGLRQTHAGLKSDSNAAFSEFILGNYSQWLHNENSPPILSPNVLEHYLAPVMRKSNRVFFIVLDCMRLDQFCAIESLLTRYFEFKRNYYYSIMPTSAPFSRTALFSGEWPSDLANSQPGLWANPNLSEKDTVANEKGLMAQKLRSLGFDFPVDPAVVSIGNANDASGFLSNIHTYDKERIVTLVIDFMDLLTQSRSTSTILREIAPDESAFRSLTQSWFQYSPLLQILKDLSRQECTVVLTTDHGSVLCTRPTEVYGTQELSAGVRYIFGEDIMSDERHTLYLSDPAVFKLPQPTPKTSCIISKGNYHFVSPRQFEHYHRQPLNTFQHGGISMEEMIVPFAVLTPR